MVAVASKTTVDLRGLQLMQSNLDKFEDDINSIVIQSKRYADERNLDQIRIYPRKAVLPFQFTTKRSELWYFANKVKRGNKKGRYRRTGKLAKSWKTSVDRGNGIITATLRNTMDAAFYVYGNQNGKHQVPGHKTTGWKMPHGIKLWEKDLLERFNELYKERIGDLSEVNKRS